MLFLRGNTWDEAVVTAKKAVPGIVQTLFARREDGTQRVVTG